MCSFLFCITYITLCGLIVNSIFCFSEAIQNVVLVTAIFPRLVPVGLKDLMAVRALHDIDRLKLGDLRVIADVAGLEIIIRKTE